MANVIKLKDQQAEHKQSVLECRILSLDDFDQWVRHPYQRPVLENQKVQELAAELRANGGIIPGVLTLGRLPNDPNIYGVDYQHRIAACKLSGRTQFIGEVRTVEYGSMAEMAKDTIKLNSRLNNLRPDDVLRALEPSSPLLAQLHTACNFISYTSHVRRASRNSGVLSMSATLRCWSASTGETPSFGGGLPSAELVETLDQEDLQQLIAFLAAAYEAWKDEPEYYALWATLNLTMCMWLFRQLVMKRPDKKSRAVHLTVAEFARCLMSVSAAGDYLNWLPGRKLSDRDRSPCYTRLRAIFTKRIIDDIGHRPIFPQPQWYSGK
jgi:hypothetical protein